LTNLSIYDIIISEREKTDKHKKQSHDHCVGGSLKAKVQETGTDAAKTSYGEEALFFCDFLKKDLKKVLTSLVKCARLVSALSPQAR
jgi:hypothetical protein